MKLLPRLILICLILTGTAFGQIKWKQYQIATNTTTEISYTVVSTASALNTSGNQGILPLNLSSDTARAFFPLDIVNDANAYPWRMTVKFGNTTGILIDPYHVLTAGHAVSLNQAFGNTKIMPAYSQADSPYGFAYPEYVYILTTYAISSATDIAIIKLDRPLGALTGYSGYGYNNNQTFFTGNGTFFNPSYPSAGLFDGEQLYNWKGKMDYVTNDFVYSFRTGIVGMSGSGIFTYVNNTPVTYGLVVSTGIKFNKINATKYDGINKILTNNTPAVYDVVPLTAGVYPGAVKQGQNPDSLTFYVHNYSTQDCPSGQVTAAVYLSSDSVITEQDQLLKTITINSIVNAKRTIAIKSTDIVLPALSPGDYWIGLKLTGDNNSQNNTTGYRDAFKLKITGEDFVRISGRITSSQSAAGISGITMQGFGETIKTDYNGRYTALVPSGWSGVIIPVREGYDFSPASFSVSNATTPVNDNFTVSKKTVNVTVSVQSPVQHVPVNGVQLTGLPGEPYTNANGTVSLNLYYGWSGSAYIVKDGWNIQPYTIDYSNVTSAKNNSISAGFTISGYLYDPNGSPLNNVEMQGLPGTVHTNNYGYYTYYLDSGWAGNVYPVKNATIFNPVSREYSPVSSSHDYQDFQEAAAVYLNLKVFLSGAFVEGKDTMRTALSYRGLISQTPPDTFSNLGSPFVFKPHKQYVYSGQPANIVDWVLIEVMDYNLVSVDTVAALLRNDGQIIGTDGQPFVQLDMGILPDYYYITIRHRNHIAIMSNYQVYACANPDLYDFTASTDNVYGGELKRLKNNLYGMYSGDADYNGVVDDIDYKAYNQASKNADHGYIANDFNLDGFVTSFDFTQIAPNKKLRITSKILLTGQKLKKK